MSKKTDPKSPASAAPGDADAQPPADPFAHVSDEHWGKGGRYVVDAAGKRAPAPEHPPVTNEMEADHG